MTKTVLLKTLKKNSSREKKLLTEKEMEEIREEIEKLIEEAVEFARESPYPDPSELFEGLYV